MNDFTRDLIEKLWCKYTDVLLRESHHDWVSLRDLYDKYLKTLSRL